ncbi:MAG: 3-dehydroquinate synthase [Chloroflexota bacterium]
MDNIVLTGFMGTGKTTVGRIVAQMVAREFVDMDEVIVAREGKPIGQIVEDDGWFAFRVKESELCRELGARDGLVIATGGGALIDDDNRAALARHARMFCLQASPDEIARRLEGDERRPLLAIRDETQSVQTRIADLLQRREAAYALIPYHITTDGQSAQQVAGQIVSRAQQDTTIELKRDVRAGSESYQVVLGAGTWHTLGAQLKELLPKSQRAAIVTDEMVGPLHAATIEASLRAVGFETIAVTMHASESAKTLETVSMLYDRFIDAQLERSSVVLALGGGLVGDVAGFAAATFLRGVHFVQLPTTALSVVDASLGGKTAVNHPKGKNLIGAFKQPVLVCADREALTALPVADLRSGLAEVVKHGIIGAPQLFERLERDGLRDLPRILADAIEVKLKVIEADPHERAERATLNLGHTFGHAFETLSQYTLRHGEAVAMGLVASAKLAARLEMCAPSLVARVETLLTRLKLPTTFNQFAADDVLSVMLTDKKKEQGKIRFVLPVELGKVVVRGDVVREDVIAVLTNDKMTR